jgi:hypothetical protein
MHRAFKAGVTLPVLIRFLTPEKLATLEGSLWFMCMTAFSRRSGTASSAGFWGEDNRANWEHKEDSIRHFLKSHLVLGESYTKWWGPAFALSGYLFDSKRMPSRDATHAWGMYY